MTVMKIEILHIADCPNWTATGELVMDVLNELGAGNTPIEYVLLTTPEEVAAVPFAGSPTVLIDGVDAFPSEGATADLACRVYRTGGHFAGSPSKEDLREALGAALASTGNHKSD